MIASDPEENGYIHANEDLVSPPRNWPASFKANKTLSTFLNKTIKATKARLSSAVPDDIKAEVGVLPLRKIDSAANAAMVHERMGWPVLTGFAIFELDEQPNIFVAKHHAWNLHPRNVWVDLSPRDKRLQEVLLVESDVEAAFARVGLKGPSMPALPSVPTPTAQAGVTASGAAAPRAEDATPDVSDAAAAAVRAPAASQLVAPPAPVDSTPTPEVLKAQRDFAQLFALACAAGEDASKIDKEGTLGAFGQGTVSTADDVLLYAILGWPPKMGRPLRPPVAAYVHAAIALLQLPADTLHRALRRHLAPDGTLASLLAGPAAASDACWLRAKTLVGAKALMDDARVVRAGLRQLAKEDCVCTRAEWARCFGHASMKKARTTWGVHVSSATELRARVNAAGGRLEKLSVAELLSLLRPTVVPIWHTPLGFFSCAASLHPAEVRTTDGVRALAKYLKARLIELEAEGWEPGGLPIIEVGAGNGRLSHLLNETCLIKVPREAALGRGIELSVEVRASDKDAGVDGDFWVERMDAPEAVQKHDPLIVIAAWMPGDADWTPAFRAGGVCEYILIGSMLDAEARGIADVAGGAHAPYERVVLDGVSAELSGVADVLGKASPFGEGGSVVAVSYRRPPDEEPTPAATEQEAGAADEIPTHPKALSLIADEMRAP